jgi:hypothetical protein
MINKMPSFGLSAMLRLEAPFLQPLIISQKAHPMIFPSDGLFRRRQAWHAKKPGLPQVADKNLKNALCKIIRTLCKGSVF